MKWLNAMVGAGDKVYHRQRPVHGEIEAFPISACLQTEVILGHIGASLKLIISVITIYTVAI